MTHLEGGGGQAAARRRVATTNLRQTVMQRADATVEEAAAELDRGVLANRLLCLSM